MEPLQPDVGGCPVLPVTHAPHVRFFKDALLSHVLQAPSFFHPLQTLAMQDIENTPTGLHRRSQTIFFRPPHLQQLNKPFEWSLISKFSVGYNKTNPKLGRPSIQHLRDHFIAMDLKGEFQLGLLDNRHVLIHLNLQLDYLRLYSRSVWYIGGLPMRVFKWSPEFHVDKESSIAPIWVSFPRLPVQFFQRDALFAIARLLGVPLRLDAATMSLKRPSMARVQIEIDILKQRPDRIWIGMGEDHGFWQKLEFENVPSYCTHCWHMGHSESSCTIQHPELKNTVSNDKREQVYVPKVSASTSISHPASTPQITSVSTVSASVSSLASAPLDVSASATSAGVTQLASTSVSDVSAGVTQLDSVTQLHKVPPNISSNESSASVSVAAGSVADTILPLVLFPRTVPSPILVSQEIGFPSQLVQQLPVPPLAMADTPPSVHIMGPQLSSPVPSVSLLENLSVPSQLPHNASSGRQEGALVLELTAAGDEVISYQDPPLCFLPTTLSLDDLHLHRMCQFQSRDLVIHGLKDFCSRMSQPSHQSLALEDVPKRRGRPRKTILQQAAISQSLPPMHCMVTRSIGTKTSQPQ